MRYAVYLACLMLFLAALVTASWLGGGWWIGAVVFRIAVGAGHLGPAAEADWCNAARASCSRWGASSR